MQQYGLTIKEWRIYDIYLGCASNYCNWSSRILPIGLISPLFHMNDLNYGYVKESNLNEIVTSGIAGWGYPIRTEKHSEYVIIDIKNK